MEGLRNYQAAQSGFAGAAEEINENAAAFRGKAASVRNENKSLVQQARAATDLNALKGMGEEAAVRAFKVYGGKAAGWVDRTAFGGKIGRDTEGLKNMLGKKAKSMLNTAKSKATGSRNVDDEVGDDGEEGIEMTGDDVEGGFLENIDGGWLKNARAGIGKTSAPDEGLDEGGDGWGDLSQAEKEQELFGHTDDTQFNQRQASGEDGSLETKTDEPEGKTEEPDGDDVEQEGTKEEEDDPDEEGDLGADEGAEVGEGVAEDVGEGVGEEALVGGMEAGGAALDATGVGALIGIPLQIAGAVLEGGALYEAGKSVVDWFEEDILGDKPKVKTIAPPVKGRSIAQSGLVAAPVFDSSMDMPSSSASF